MTDTRDFYRTFLRRFRYQLPPSAYPGMAREVAKTIDQMCPSIGVGGNDADLRRDGFMRTPELLTPDVCKEIISAAILSELPVHDGWERTSGEWTRLETIPQSVHVAHYSDLRFPTLIYAATHPSVIGAAASYFGCLPTISYVSLWWSMAGRDAPQDAELFHMDKHDYRFVKLFIPMTNVDEESGPTDIIKGSHKIEFWQQRMLRSEDVERFHSMCHQQRKSDEDIAYFFHPNEIETMTCLPGHGYLADTSAWHRGRLPKSRNRLMFQVCMTLLPDPKVEPQLLAIPDFAAGWHERYGNALTPEQLRFVSRLVVAS